MKNQPMYDWREIYVCLPVFWRLCFRVWQLELWEGTVSLSSYGKQGKKSEEERMYHVYLAVKSYS